MWGWQEMSFLLGFVTGSVARALSRRMPGLAALPAMHCGRSSITNWPLVVAGAGVHALTRDGANQVGLWTFVILWAMRQSAKLNVFLGVRNLSEEFLPAHLRYLESFFARKAMNPLWPVSVTAATLASPSLLWQRAHCGTTRHRFDATGVHLSGDAA